ncbi:Reverse transcriptase (RNA-dependent DNA polymerase) [Popillia japonica]|uniref:Reverse transcriptase (RNA-dependent DNA polymerase) n=1 Tax=Popillia japonica TaxID=7064 RepID=A0AAW1IBF5_POPJA
MGSSEEFKVPKLEETNYFPWSCTYVFKEKKNQNGYCEKFKTRLVAQGCKQIPGIDFEETYSPVIYKDTLRLLLALAVEKGWECEHLDVNSGYLNSPIQETVFMEQQYC